jgi:hypothetical protein
MIRLPRSFCARWRLSEWRLLRRQSGVRRLAAAVPRLVHALVRQSGSKLPHST